MAMAVALRRLSKGRLPTAFRTAQGALAASALVSPSRFSSAVRFSLLLLLIIIMFAILVKSPIWFLGMEEIHDVWIFCCVIWISPFSCLPDFGFLLFLLLLLLVVFFSEN